MLYMLGVLEVSGKFRIYHPATPSWPPAPERLSGKGPAMPPTAPPVRASLLAALLLASGCAGGAASKPAEPAGAVRVPRDGPLPSLAEAYKGTFLVGAAINPGQVLMGDTHQLIARQFDVVVADNDMKPLLLNRREGRYEFGMADEIVDWANKNGIKVRGHCLVWHQQAAPWMFTQDGKPVSREVLIERMRTYIHDVVGHFKGKVWAWDVVNEAFAPGEAGIETENGWRKSDWYRIIGPDYVGLAFQFAHEADPDALLFYNDYETQNPAKRQLILDLVKSLQKKGIPIHGVGHQAHVYLAYPSAAELETTIREVARLGLHNHITELDVSLRERWNAPIPEVTPAVLERQAQRYAELFQMFKRNKDQIDAVLVWGITDEISWLKPDQPLLFSEYKPKPAFWAVIDQAAAR
jgi:endo-1,4-beta-xylanase